MGAHSDNDHDGIADQPWNPETAPDWPDMRDPWFARVGLDAEAATDEEIQAAVQREEGPL